MPISIIPQQVETILLNNFTTKKEFRNTFLSYFPSLLSKVPLSPEVINNLHFCTQTLCVLPPLAEHS